MSSQKSGVLSPGARSPRGASFALALLALLGGAAIARAGGEPRVVNHPLTAEELLQEADFADYPPLMAGLGAWSRADPARSEARARALSASPARTDAPFVDWARHAAMALAELDPEAPADRERAAGWAREWDALRGRARAAFDRNRAGRAESIADNALCAFRDAIEARRACLAAAFERAGEADPALGLSWGAWALAAAAGLESSMAMPGGWERKKALMAAAGRPREHIDELERKAERLGRWAKALAPAQVPRERLDARDAASDWARRRGWTPGREGAGLTSGLRGP